MSLAYYGLCLDCKIAVFLDDISKSEDVFAQAAALYYVNLMHQHAGHALGVYDYDTACDEHGILDGSYRCVGVEEIKKL